MSSPSAEELEQIWATQTPAAFGIGVVLLILAMFYIYPSLPQSSVGVLWSVAFVVLGAIGIDSTVHTLFTSPQEETWYWIFKAFAGSAATLWMLGQGLTTRSIATACVFFAGIISVWYRSIEVLWKVLFGLPRQQKGVLGGHTPRFIFGTNVIDFQNNPVLLTLLWAITHTSAFAIPSLILKHLRG